MGNYISYNRNLANKLNFSNLIPGINNIINLWKQRNLTTAGKIQVFRSLAFSKLTFVSSMNSVPGSFIDDLQKIHKDFIWGGRKPKIQHSSLIGEYKDGGLRDVNILSSFKSLKVSWIRRLFDDNFHPWKLFAEHFLRPIGGKYIFHENLKIAKSIDGLVKELPEFYRNLLSVWAQNSHIFITSEINHPTDILKQQLFNNKFVLKKKDALFDKDFHTRGLCKVGDLYSDDSQLKPWAYIREEFNLEPGHFLHWFSIVQCIPKNWKNVLNTPVPDVQSSLGNTAAHPFQNLRPNSVYRKIISNVFQAPSAQKTVLKMALCSNIDWNRAYVLPRLCTIDSYLRVFQYKILNNILFLNS